MAQSGYTPILIYASGTASAVPSAANLTSSANGAELALNYADGKLYYKNSSGVVTLLAQAGAGSISVSNDTSTSSNVYPAFLAATSGSISTIYTGNANLLYKPSTGELQAQAMVAINSLFVGAATVATNYTIPNNYNAMSPGPTTVGSGITVTVPSGSTWTIV